MAIERVSRVDKNISSIEKALGEMLKKLNAELENVVASGKVDKTKLNKILSEVDNQIINNKTIQNYLLGDDNATKKKVMDLIQDTVDAVRETIEEFKDPSQGDVLTDATAKEVEGVFKSKVVESETIKRVKALQEYDSKADTIELESTDKRLSGVTSELEDVTDKLNKVTAVEKHRKGSETTEQVADRLSAEAEKFTLKGDKYYEIVGETYKTVAEGGYDFEKISREIGIDNYNYKNNPDNCKKVSEFLTQLQKLKYGNPEIKTIFDELSKAGIKPNKKGEFEIKPSINPGARKKLNDALNKKLKSKPINFKAAKSNTQKECFKKIDLEIESLLGKEFMDLYPEELKRWKEMLDESKKTGNEIIKDTIWAEMNKFLKSKDISAEILDIKDLEDETTLAPKKEELEAKKKELDARHLGEIYENVNDEVKNIEVMGIDIESKKNIRNLTPEEFARATDSFYRKKQEEFIPRFYKFAPDELKKVGFFERLGYAISHRTLHPKREIIAQRIKDWSKEQIAAAISNKVSTVSQQVGERDAYYKTKAAYTPEQLKEVRKKESEALENSKKTHRRKILADGEKADEALTNTRKDAERDSR